jgi:hypothetical protein
VTRRLSAIAVVALALGAAAPALAAEPQLIGSFGGGPIRFLDRDLRVESGRTHVPRGSDGTVFSPDRRRVAAYDVESRFVTVFNRRTGRVVARRPLGEARSVSFPTRNRVVAVRGAWGSGENGYVRSIDLRTGRAQVTRPGGWVRDEEQVGRERRLLMESYGGLSVVDVGVAGNVKRRFPITLPERFQDGRAVGLWLEGDLVLASAGDRHALIRVGGETAEIDLPDGYWYWAGPDLIQDVFKIARVDRDAMQVTKVIDTGGAFGALTPFRGGFVIGMGRQRYDRNLELIAENERAPVERTPPLLVGNRLYGITADCIRETQGAAISDARTGRSIRVLREVSTPRLGVLGGGALARVSPEACP